ncbi:MAG: glycosyltransferase [Vampirovibrionales bacterium]
MSKPLSLLFVMTDFLGGGIETILVNYVNALAQQPDYAVTVVILGALNKNHQYLAFSPLVPVHHFGVSPRPAKVSKGWQRWVRPLTKGVWLVQSAIAKRSVRRQLQQLHTQHAFDVVIDFKSGFSCLIDLFKQWNVLTLTWIHGSYSEYFVKQQIYERHAIAQYDGVVCLTQRFKTACAIDFPDLHDKLSVIYNPLDAESIVQRSLERASLPPSAQARLDQPYLVSVARLDKQKDFETLLVGFQQFVHAHPASPLQLYLVGEGNHRPVVEARIHELELTHKVHLLGEQANPSVWMRHAQAVVLCSVWEGLPTVLIEALCCQALIISSDCPDGPDEILAYGAYGVLVPPSDPKALANVFGQLEAGTLQKPAIVDDVAHTTQRFTTSQSINAFQKLLEKHHKNSLSR